MTTRDETAISASDMHGDKLYQRRARRALPILVQQAGMGTRMTYSTLAKKMRMPNARNLNYVLGSVGKTLQDLGRRWRQRIPPIQCLVVNKQSDLPGEGFLGFLQRSRGGLSQVKLRRLVENEMERAYAYPHWDEVLAALDLKPLESSGVARLMQQARFIRGRGGAGSKESLAHRQLKERIAADPRLVGLPRSMGPGVVEYSLPSGDVVDVVFEASSVRVAVEVKSSISVDGDVARGLFQCVKYLAVLVAQDRSNRASRRNQVMLACDRGLTPDLSQLRRRLGVVVRHPRP
jgi:hypothetical protein